MTLTMRMTALALLALSTTTANANTAMVADPCPPAAPAGDDAFVQRLLEPGFDFLAARKQEEEQARARGESGSEDYAKRVAEQRARDWPNLCRYAAENAALRKPARVVFMGDSITEYWQKADPQLFSNGVVNRGISGQTSAQMLLRFYADVIALRPQVVHLMAGTNDIAGNTGPTSEQAFKNNIMAMAELARAHNIKVVLGAIAPADAFWWSPQHQPAAQIRTLNHWLKSYAQQNKFGYIDYYEAMATSSGALKKEYANDGVHPNTNGYKAMRELMIKAVPLATTGP